MTVEAESKASVVDGGRLAPEGDVLLIESGGASTADEMAANHTIRELKEIALRYGVSQAGRKLEICQRIISARSASPDAPPE